MIYKNNTGTNVIQFGTGDIEVGSGRTLSDDGTEMFPTCVFIELKSPHEIGALVNPGHENGPAEQRADAHTSLMFTDIRSVDVVMDYLAQVKRRFERNGLKVMSMQEITDECKP